MDRALAWWRSLLYVPGGEWRKIVKASGGLGADAVILDLEDSVPEGLKGEARRLVARALGELDWRGVDVCVRVNPLGSPHALADLSLVAGLDGVACVVVPKAEPGDARAVHRLTGLPVVPIVETPAGLRGVWGIAGEEGVVALNWGPADLAAAMGASLDALASSEAIRLTVAAAAHAAGVSPVDAVYFRVGDLEGLRRDTIRARELGFTGRTVIHPSHVPVVNEVFTPSEGEVEWARRVVEAYESAVREGRGAVKLGDSLVDAVHYRIARRILERARRITGPGEGATRGL